jgi:hypothetical protein
MLVFRRSDVDVVVLNAAPPLLKQRATARGRLLFCRDHAARVRFEVSALREYLDTTRLRELEDRSGIEQQIHHQPREGRTDMKTAIALLLIGSVAGVAFAAGPQSKCLAGKNKCVSKKVGSLLKCEQKAETPGRPADPNAGACVNKAKAKFDGGSNPTTGCFEKLENKTPNDCVTLDDTASVEMLVDACVAAIVEAIDPDLIVQSKCGVSKKKCAAKKLKSILKCHLKAETPGKPNDPNFTGCLDKAKAKFDGGRDPTKGCFEKLENKSGNDCLPPLDNTAAVEGIIDNSCVGAFVTALETAPFTKITTGDIVTAPAWYWNGSWGDYDDDGWLDLFVGSTFVSNTNYLYHNNRDGTFTIIDAAAMPKIPSNQHGSAWGDYDNDGHLDLIVTAGNPELTHNVLYHNNGDGTFSAITTGPIYTESCSSERKRHGDGEPTGLASNRPQ